LPPPTRGKLIGNAGEAGLAAIGHPGGAATSAPAAITASDAGGDAERGKSGDAYPVVAPTIGSGASSRAMPIASVTTASHRGRAAVAADARAQRQWRRPAQSGRRCSGVPAPRSPAGTIRDLSSGSPANAAVSCHRRCAARPAAPNPGACTIVRGRRGRARAGTSAAPAAPILVGSGAARLSTSQVALLTPELDGRADVLCHSKPSGFCAWRT